MSKQTIKYVWSRYTANPVEHETDPTTADDDYQPLCGATISPNTIYVADQPSGLAPLCQRCINRREARERRAARPTTRRPRRAATKENTRPMKIITIQPSERVDHITDDGRELTQLPYPFHVDEQGFIQRQDFWRGKNYKVIGFAKDLAKQEINLWWWQAVKNPEQAVGMYVVTADDQGKWGVHMTAIASATVNEQEPEQAQG